MEGTISVLRDFEIKDGAFVVKETAALAAPGDVQFA